VAETTTARLNGLYDPAFRFDRRQHFPVGTVMPGMDPAGREVPVSDARALQRDEGLSEAAFFARHSFVLLPHVSAVDDWDQNDGVYQREIDELIRARLFPGRRVEIQQGPNVLRRGRDTPTPMYADGVHSDGGVDLDDYVHNIGAFAGEEAAQWWRNLYERREVEGLIWIDVWRPTNMRAPLQHMPLALCDPTSVEARDVVPVAMTGIAPEGRESRHLTLRFSAEQRWYYYPRMTCDELLAFKLAEFWKTPTPVRNCFHSAFDDPLTPEGAEERQSCEHRVGVLMLRD
jgi:hypothetical protein